MTYTEQDVERVAEALWNEFDDRLSWQEAGFFAKDPLNEYCAVEVPRMYRMARAALEAMEREPVEDVLDGCGITEMHVGLLVTGKWQVMLTTDGGEWGANNQPVGWGDTPSEAIRNAVAAAKGGKA